MAFSYKTPGAYIEEIVKLPPSVAQVETAIPVFIGVTQKATEVVVNDLLGVSKRIGSLADYELYFGFPDQAKAKVTVNQNVPSDAKLTEPYYNNMYYAIKHYFDNGGGPCFVHAIGDYSRQNVDAETYKTELKKMDLADEVTLIVLPDVGGLKDRNKIYDIYNAALSKAAVLQDKFVIINVINEKTGEKIDIGKSKTEFRNIISNNGDEIKYGAAYFPDLDTNYSFDYSTSAITMNFSTDVRNIETEVIIAGVKTKVKPYDILNGLSYKPVKYMYKLKQALDELDRTAFSDDVSADNAEALSYFINNKTESLSLYFNQDAAKLTDLNEKKKQVLAFFLSNVHSLETAKANNQTIALEAIVSAAATKEEAIPKAVEAAESAVKAAKASIKAAETTTPPADVQPANTALTAANAALTKANAADTLAKAKTAASDAKTAAAAAQTASVTVVDANKFDDKKKAFKKVIEDEVLAIYGSMPPVPNVDNGDYTKLNDSFLLRIGSFFNSLFEAKLKEAFLGIPVTLPPSPAMAGIYAKVDRTRGVWKAPANVSVNAVLKPAVPLSDLDQEDFNVDAENGKSINCIRTFIGRGNLVWGARTLAGNNNEWRYVNVRRFFNMVEESCQNSSRQFIFEPNDANTWVRVKGMIDNFLTNLWRVGALQGAKPEHAFYTAVGLNQTMTQDDILNGLLIVEIGLAVVRPAEFIVLRFSHKLAVS